MRLHIIRNERIENVGKSQSCMVPKLRIICKQTVPVDHLESRERERLISDLDDLLQELEEPAKSLRWT